MSWITQRNDYLNNMLGSRPQVGPVGANPLDGYSVSQADLDAENAYNQRWGQEGMKWYNALSPQDQAAHDAEVAAHNAKISKQGKIIKPLTLATLAAVGMGAGSQAFGGLEGLFGGGAEAGAGEGIKTLSSAGMDLGFSGPLPAMEAYTPVGSGINTLSGAGMDLSFSGALPSIPQYNPITPGIKTLGGAGLDLGFSGALPDLPVYNPVDTSAITGLSGGSPYQSGANVEGGQGGGLEAANIAGPGGSNSNSLFSQLKSMLPSGPTEALKLASSLGGLYSNYTSNRNLSNLGANLAGLYGPGSAYEEQLRKELQRRDAAAGRRSQYGPRAVELQARLAQLASGQSQSLANIYGQENASRNNMINSGLKLADQMGIWGKLASLFGN